MRTSLPARKPTSSARNKKARVFLILTRLSSDSDGAGPAVGLIDVNDILYGTTL